MIVFALMAITLLLFQFSGASIFVPNLVLCLTSSIKTCSSGILSLILLILHQCFTSLHASKCPIPFLRKVFALPSCISSPCFPLQTQDSQGAVVAEAATADEDPGQVQDQLRRVRLRPAGTRGHAPKGS